MMDLKVTGLILKNKCAKPPGWKPSKPFLKGNKAACKENRPADKNGGRPKGKKTIATRFLEDIVASYMESVIDATKLSALKGSSGAQRLFWERMLPIRKGAPIKVDLGKINTPAEISETLNNVFSKIEAGEITLEEANMINSVLETKLKAIEIYHQGDEIKELKAAMGIKAKGEKVE